MGKRWGVVPSALALMISVASCTSEDTSSPQTLTSGGNSSTCGEDLTVPSLRVYCGSHGAKVGQGFEFSGPDAPSTNSGVDIENTAGTKLTFGALNIKDATVAYFLAEPEGAGVRIVDLVDVPVGATDFRIDGAQVALVDDLAFRLDVYRVVDRSLLRGDLSGAAGVDTAAACSSPTGCPSRQMTKACDAVTASMMAELLPGFDQTSKVSGRGCSWMGPSPSESFRIVWYFPYSRDESYISGQVQQLRASPTKISGLGDIAGGEPGDGSVRVIAGGFLLEAHLIENNPRDPMPIVVQILKVVVAAI